MRQLEAGVENYLVRSCMKAGMRCLKVRVVGRRGFPDRMIPAGEGWTVLVETKTAGGRLSPGQRKEHTRLSCEGYEVYTVWTKEQVNDLMSIISNRGE